LPPSEFLILAEQSGLMVALGRWVLKTACRAVRTWPTDSAGTGPFVSVNLSARQIQDEDLVRDVSQALESERLDPPRLVVEITESAFMLDADATEEVLSRLKEVGIGIALDDFGSGHSSLGYLRRFPLDIIKIDGSFISGTGGQLGDSTFVRAILKLAQSLDLRVSAEWIESAEQFHALRELGCQWGQGYHLSRPLDAESVASVIGRKDLQGVAR
jgi:EAL domain-containing protein (putative c-di-GMP-specific phosphodiesterase class I)